MDTKAEAALQEMKKFIEILPTLTAPIPGEILMMYLAASTKSISAALFAKREEEQVHEGSCGFNAELRSMVVRITKQGYYWSLMHRDAAKVLQDCEKCKEQSAIRKVAESNAITARSGWPFSH
uniref:Reverse transcriptase domain-containing protein n=1 Tax=Tanacetum cinerariifolium TaxID=118510 RepID=A0A699JNG9_TANCI|nr:hypothetical protein [Tanacetum cinerariifolium]